VAIRRCCVIKASSSSQERERGRRPCASARVLVLALPDLEHAKTAVLNSLTSASGQRTYDAIREFVAWYCSEPRLAFNRTVVLRCRVHLEQRKYAPAPINLRLAQQIVMLEAALQEAAGAAGVTLTVENGAILITPPP
jgi:hypothetical protein